MGNVAIQLVGAAVIFIDTADDTDVRVAKNQTVEVTVDQWVEMDSAVKDLFKVTNSPDAIGSIQLIDDVQMFVSDGVPTDSAEVTIVTTVPGDDSPPTNEQQTVTLTGGPTGGTFTLTFDGETTTPIAYNASAATVKAALDALSNITTVTVTRAGSGTSGSPYVYTVTFSGTGLAATDVAEMTGDGEALTGTTGDGVAGRGSIVVDSTNGKLYINTGTKAEPTWTVVGGQS